MMGGKTNMGNEMGNGIGHEETEAAKSGRREPIKLTPAASGDFHLAVCPVSP